MEEYILTEFSIFYKRLMKVERYLKTLIIHKYTNAYDSNAYKILYRYFKDLESNRHSKDRTFSKIFSSTKTNNEKLISSVNSMFISEILYLFWNRAFLKNKKVKNSFFYLDTETNSTNFQKMAKNFIRFRNCIAHCDEKKFKLEKQNYLTGLLFFEKLLNCNEILDFNLLNKIEKTRKLSIREILELIAQTKPHYFKNDKLLILLFDDIALMTGYTFKDLPQRWSVIRQKYILAKQMNICDNNKKLKNEIKTLQQVFDFK